jgi:hypothetical protein
MGKAEANEPNNLSDGDNTTHRAASNKDNDDFKKICLFFAMFLILPLLFVFVVCVAYADRIAILNQSGLKEDPSLMAELRSLKLEVHETAPALNALSAKTESISTSSQGWTSNEQQGAISNNFTLGFNLAPHLTPAHLTYLLCIIPCTIQSRIRLNQTGAFGGRSQDGSLEVYEAECIVWRMKECNGVVIPLIADKDAYGRECKIEGSLHWYLEMGKVVIKATPFIILFVICIWPWVA